jgi:hypothetical protein
MGALTRTMGALTRTNASPQFGSRKVSQVEMTFRPKTLRFAALPKVVINAGGRSRRVAGILFRKAISHANLTEYGFTRETGKYHVHRYPEGVSGRTLFTPEAAAERRLGT